MNSTQECREKFERRDFEKACSKVGLLIDRFPSGEYEYDHTAWAWKVCHALTRRAPETVEGEPAGEVTGFHPYYFSVPVIQFANAKHQPVTTGGVSDEGVDDYVERAIAKLRTAQDDKMHYRRALYLACNGDKELVKQYMERTIEYGSHKSTTSPPDTALSSWHCNECLDTGINGEGFRCTSSAHKTVSAAPDTADHIGDANKMVDTAVPVVGGGISEGAIRAEDSKNNVSDEVVSSALSSLAPVVGGGEFSFHQCVSDLLEKTFENGDNLHIFARDFYAMSHPSMLSPAPVVTGERDLTDWEWVQENPKSAAVWIDALRVIEADRYSLSAQVERMRLLIEHIDVKAEAALCQFKLDGTRAFLHDIRQLIALSATGQEG